MNQETQNNTVNQTEAARELHQKQWEDKAFEYNRSRSLGKKILGKGKTDAYSVMLDEAYADHQDYEETHPEVPTLTYEKHPEIRFGTQVAGPIGVDGSPIVRHMKVELDSSVDLAQERALKVINDEGAIGGKIVNPQVRMPDGSLVAWDNFVEPAVERNREATE